MSISLKTHKLLWGRSGNMCAFPGCKKSLVIEETETDDPSVIGEEAHIVAEKENGPRGISDLPLDKRNRYDNLVLLCSIHHKVIDDQVIYYTVEKIKEFKTTHESWIKENLLVDPVKLRDDERYATYIEKFIGLTDLHGWTNWTSWIIGSMEVFPKERFEALQTIPDYIVSRIWPHRYPLLEAAFFNFKSVLNDLISVYYKYPADRDGDSESGYRIAKFYKDYNRRHNPNYDAELENKMVEKYNYHLALIADLVLELTRAANYICDRIRDFIFAGFRIEEGALLVMRGDILVSHTYRVEYRGEERSEYPYPGLRKFMEQRTTRDLHIGSGVEEDYFKKTP